MAALGYRCFAAKCADELLGDAGLCNHHAHAMYKVASIETMSLIAARMLTTVQGRPGRALGCVLCDHLAPGEDAWLSAEAAREEPKLCHSHVLRLAAGGADAETVRRSQGALVARTRAFVDYFDTHGAEPVPEAAVGSALRLLIGTLGLSSVAEFPP